MNLEHCSIQQALPVSTEPPVEKQCVQRRVLVTYLKINKKVVLQTRGSSLCQAICLSQPALRVKDLAENRTVSLRNSMLQCQVCIKPILGLLGKCLPGFAAGKAVVSECLASYGTWYQRTPLQASSQPMMASPVETPAFVAAGDADPAQHLVTTPGGLASARDLHALCTRGAAYARGSLSQRGLFQTEHHRPPCLKGAPVLYIFVEGMPCCHDQNDTQHSCWNEMRKDSSSCLHFYEAQGTYLTSFWTVQWPGRYPSHRKLQAQVICSITGSDCCI